MDTLANQPTNMILKEKRTVISVDSCQRKLFDTQDLRPEDEDLFRSYLTDEEFIAFRKLWNAITSVQEELATYREYAANHSITTTVINGNTTDACRQLLRGLQGQDDTNPTINSDLLKLLLQVSDTNEYSGTLSIINALNAFAMAATSVNPAFFWRPFCYDAVTQKAKLIVYREQSPGEYRITLPRIINHVKSIRLVSTEVPNTLNNITDRNNIITISLRYATDTTDEGISLNVPRRPVALSTSATIFNFILVKLDVGHYDMDSLIAHMNDRINRCVAEQVTNRFGTGGTFTVTWNQQTGVVRIVCNRKELEFHMKFYSRFTELHGESHGLITDFTRDLWYMLGFPWPYEINSDATDKYTKVFTNKVSFGVHPTFAADHIDDDIFGREDAEPVEDPLDPENTLSYPNISVITGSAGPADPRYQHLKTERAYRYPSIDFRYIYLVINGFRSMDHMITSETGQFTEHDFFAKVQLNAAPGQIAYNTFVCNPLVFTDVIDKVEYLDVRWVDDHGQPVEFNGVEHSLTLEFIHYISCQEANSYNTRLGVVDHRSYPEFLVPK